MFISSTNRQQQWMKLIGVFWFITICCANVVAVSPTININTIDRTSSSLYRYAVIHDIIEHEQQCADTHYCVYHGMSKGIFITLLANTYLDHFINGTPLADNFIKLRHNGDLYDESLPLDKYIQYDINDHCSPYQNQLLSVNMSFPGNIAYVASNTFKYFRNDGFMKNEDTVIQNIVSHYITREEKRAEIEQAIRDTIIQNKRASTGALLQICIPKELINSCVYISESVGTPVVWRSCSRPLLWFNQPYDDYPDTQMIFEAYQNNDFNTVERYLPYDITEMQARIRLDASLFSQPGKIQIYAYHTLGNDVCTQLYNKLQGIITEK